MRKSVLAVALAVFTLPVFGASLVFHAEVPVAPAEYASTDGTDAQVATNGSVYAATWTDYRVNFRTAYVARFRADGSVIDPTGVAIPSSRLAGAILWTGRAFLIAYIDDDNTVMARTLTPDGVLSDPVELFGVFYLGPTRLRMATNGETVLIVSSQATAALLDLEGRKLRQFPLPLEVALSLDVEAAGSTYLVAGSDHQARVVTQIVHANGELGATRSFAGSGVAIATDGHRFLLAWGRESLQTQFVSIEGEFIGAARTLTSGMISPVSAVWRGGEYLLGYHKYPQSYAQRLGADGAPLGNVVTINLGDLIRNGIFTGGLMDIAAANGEGVVVSASGPGGIIAEFFDAQSITATEPLQTPTRINTAARRQSQVRLARNGNGIVTGWVERQPMAGHEIRLSAGPGSTPVLVDSDAQTLVDVVVESGVVWVVWTADRTLYTRRYTTALQPIDAARQKLHDYVDADWNYVAVAAGGGAVAVVLTTSGDAFTSDTFVEAYLLRSTPLALDIAHTLVSHDSGRDHDVAAAYDGNAFVVVWANASGFYPHHPRFSLDDDILTTRMTTAGTVLGTPATITRSKSVNTLFAARGISGVAAVWQTLDRRAYAAYVDEKVVRDLAAEGRILGSIAAHDDGFLLTRVAVDDVQQSPAPAELEVVTLGSNLTTTSVTKLPVIEIEPFRRQFDHLNLLDADVLGGPTPVLAYTRVAPELGRVSRVFARGLREVVRRRAVR